jgi:microcystin-dependent protein
MSLPVDIIENVIKPIVLERRYPIGSIVQRNDNTNPSTLFGGTWETFAPGRCLVGLDTSITDFNTIGKTGGSSTVTLTVQELPSHTHTQDSHSHIQDDHNHETSTSITGHVHSTVAHTHPTSGAHSHTIPAHYHSIPAHYHKIYQDNDGVYVTGADSAGSSGGVYIYAAGAIIGSYTTATGTTQPFNSGTLAANYGYYQSGSAYRDITTYGMETNTSSETSVTWSMATNASFGSSTIPTATVTPTNNSTTATNQSTGGSQPHSNLQPYQVVRMWKRIA